MFITLIISNIILSSVICLLAVAVFRYPLDSMLKKHFSEESCNIWSRYILFFISIMSIAAGTRIWDIERYLIDNNTTSITEDILVMELFRTSIATLASNALLTFLVLLGVWIALLAKRKDN